MSLKGEKMDIDKLKTAEGSANKGNFWCHIRKDFFKWEDAMAFWKAHNWDGTPKKV